jgi:hypothetical protein
MSTFGDNLTPIPFVLYEFGHEQQVGQAALNSKNYPSGFGLLATSLFLENEKPFHSAGYLGRYARKRSGMSKTLTFEFWVDDGWLIGRLKEVPSVFSQDETIEELEENIRDAYHLKSC